MRILYLDIDTLRPDHLGCYGYHRDTSPNLDAIAREGTVFTNCHTSDAPCLPSRTALFSGQFGIHTGVVNHGGVAADPYIEGPDRDFRSRFFFDCWPKRLRDAGLYTAAISTFGERHSAWSWYAGFNETVNCGKHGNENADEVYDLTMAWLKQHRARENWFLHVHMWDPHTPYRVPEDYGNPFADTPLPEWYNEDIRAEHWRQCGPHSAREVFGFEAEDGERTISGFPRQPAQIPDMDAARSMFDNYDVGVHYADHYIGKIIEWLKAEGLYEDTVIIISSDHGENLGELNVYGDHQFADQITTRIPMIIRWPGSSEANRGRQDDGFIYNVDMAATSLDMLDIPVPESWDGVSFAERFRAAETVDTRPYLVVSQGAWSCQRGVRFDDYLLLRSYHEGFHGLPDLMLFNVVEDPHEQHDLALERPDLVNKGLQLLEEWHTDMMRTSHHGGDPMWTVIQEGGPLHVRGELPRYLERLRATGRENWAEHLAAAYPDLQRPAPSSASR